MMRHDRRLTVTVITLGLAALVVTAASSGILKFGGSPERSGPEVAAEAAAAAGITDLSVSTSSPSGRASVVKGLRGRDVVVAFAIGPASTAFRERATFLAQNPAVFQVSWGGSSPATIDFGAVAGIVAPSVNAIHIEGVDGTVKIVPIVDDSFTADLDATFAGGKLAVLGAAGNRLATYDIAKPTSPGK